MPAAAVTALNRLAAIQDRVAPGGPYPKQGVRVNGMPLDPGEGITERYAAVETNHDRSQVALRLIPADPDDLSPELSDKLGADRDDFVAALRAAEDKLPSDWVGVDVAAVELER